MFKSINHIGMAVPSIQRFLEGTQAMYAGFSRSAIIVNDRQHVREMFLSDGKTVIELLEPMGDRSPLSTFLRRNPEGGLVHIAFDVEALEPALAEIRDQGGMPIGEPVPDIAFDERRIAFAMVAGQIVELIESPQTG